MKTKLCNSTLMPHFFFLLCLLYLNFYHKILQRTSLKRIYSCFINFHTVCVAYMALSLPVLFVHVFACFVKMSRGDKIFCNWLKNESSQEKRSEILQSNGLVSSILKDDILSPTTHSICVLCLY